MPGTRYHFPGLVCTSLRFGGVLYHVGYISRGKLYTVKPESPSSSGDMFFFFAQQLRCIASSGRVLSREYENTAVEACQNGRPAQVSRSTLSLVIRKLEHTPPDETERRFFSTAGTVVQTNADRCYDASVEPFRRELWKDIILVDCCVPACFGI